MTLFDLIATLTDPAPFLDGWEIALGFLNIFGTKSGAHSETVNKMPGFQEGVVKSAFGNIVPEVLDKPWEFYPGQTYADFSPETLAGLEGITGRAMGGSPLLTGAEDLATATMRGDYLDPMSNPFFDELTDALSGRIGNSVMNQFAGAFRSGTSPGAMQAIGSGVAGVLAPMLFSEYGNERARQMGTMGMAPGLYEAGYSPYQQLLGAGGMYEGQEQLGIDEAMQRHQFAQQEAYDRLARVLGLAGQYGQYGGTSTTDQSAYQFGGKMDLTAQQAGQALQFMGMGG